MADESYRADDHIQHGIDDNPEGDAKKGAVIGGVGGAAVGAAAGAMLGPLGALGGAVVGGAVAAAASGAAVGAIDKADNDNNVTGLGDDIAYEDVDEEDEDYFETQPIAAGTTLGAAGTMGYENLRATEPATGYESGEFLTGEGEPIATRPAHPDENRTREL